MAERRIDPDQRVFGEGLAALAIALGFELDRLVMRVYWNALADVPAEFREAAILEAGKRTWFKFPTPAELKRIAVERLEQRRKQAFRAMLDGSECQTCHGSRWKPVTVDGVERLKRCDCWQAGIKAMNAVGQQLELPPSREEEAQHLGELARIANGSE
jgi:hypothetical protein